MYTILDNKQIKSPLKVEIRRKQLAQLSLSESCESIILGGILGDGSLKKYSKNARYSLRHSIKQEEYFFWKAKQLEEIASPKSVRLQKADGYSKKKKYRFQSRALPVLTLLHEKLYQKSSKLIIRRQWLNHLTAQSLAVWWMDGGSIIGGGRQGVICTDGFPEPQVLLLAQYLQKVWGISVRVGPAYVRYKGRQRVYYRLWLNTTSLKKFLKIIIPYIPVQSMMYKVRIKYKDPLFQQRWISEVKKRTQLLYPE